MEAIELRIAKRLMVKPETACDLSRCLSVSRREVMFFVGSMQMQRCVEQAPPTRPGEHFRFKLTDAGRARYGQG